MLYRGVSLDSPVIYLYDLLCIQYVTSLTTRIAYHSGLRFKLINKNIRIEFTSLHGFLNCTPYLKFLLKKFETIEFEIKK